ncbi:hypothetical protein JTB14_008706 [Gonioctena quinquepunctata]|nr:hypothetical protein JTB14_008706 [Gonioctena quinquepunctata]
MKSDSETNSVASINKKKRRMSPEEAVEKKAQREKRIRENEAEPCNCGGNKATHAYLYRLKKDGTFTRHMCKGTKEETESQMGRELYTRDEFQEYTSQMERFASEYEKESGKLKTPQSSDQMDTDNSVPKIQAPTSRLAEEDESPIVKSKRLQK